MISIILVDDHQIVRQGLRALLDREIDFHVLGEGNDGLEALQMTRKFKPDVLVVDLLMPGLSGLEVTRQVSQNVPDTRVIVLSMHSDAPYVLEALRNGASGYVLKTSGVEELTYAIRAVMAGQQYISHQLPEDSIASYIEKTRETTIDPLEMLTAREREVFILAAQGLSTSEISARLFISNTTAMTHRAHLMCKLGLHNQTELVRYALKRKVILETD
ncbi:MAG: response regulator transcription factor [Anaerolineae bacterium]|nr:response regulator transcription factor [Anaerolineae bacterium]